MNKNIRAGVLKSINKEASTITAHVSTFDWDRTDERIAKGAWDLANFKKNPVVLWAHNSTFGEQRPPIAKALSITEDDKGLVSEMQFDTKSDFAMHIFSLYEREFLKSFSVGFRASKFMIEQIEGTEKKGIVWTQAELLEYSAVPIPANPGAQVGKEVWEMATKVYGKTLHFLQDEKTGLYTIDPSHIEEDSKEKAPEDLVQALKSMIILSKSINKESMDEQKLSLIETCLDVIKENLVGGYVIEDGIGVTRKDILDMHEIVKHAGEVLTRKYPDVNDLVSKLLSQLHAELKNGR